jgi:cytidyltransferase-like protein
VIFDIKNESDLELLRLALQERNIGLTSGSYDLFHQLHLVYLQRCRGLCDVLIVGVDSNDLISLRKGPDRPLVPEHQRVAIVSALSCVQAAFIMRSVNDFGVAVERLGITTIFKNQEYKNIKVLGEEKAKVVLIPDVVQHSSTSQIIEEILKQRTTKNGMVDSQITQKR